MICNPLTFLIKILRGPKNLNLMDYQKMGSLPRNGFLGKGERSNFLSQWSRVKKGQFVRARKQLSFIFLRSRYPADENCCTLSLSLPLSLTLSNSLSLSHTHTCCFSVGFIDIASVWYFNSRFFHFFIGKLVLRYYDYSIFVLHLWNIFLLTIVEGKD